MICRGRRREVNGGGKERSKPKGGERVKVKNEKLKRKGLGNIQTLNVEFEGGDRDWEKVLGKMLNNVII